MFYIIEKISGILYVYLVKTFLSKDKCSSVLQFLLQDRPKLLRHDGIRNEGRGRA